MTAVSDAERRATIGEILALWLGTLLLIRLVLVIADAGVHEIVLAAVPLLFMYAPVFLLRWRGRDPDAYPLALPAFSDRQAWLDALRVNAVWIGIIALPWVLAYDQWQTRIFGKENLWIWPTSPGQLLLYHLFFVAIPEEMFYRGYMQSRFDEIYPPRWRLFGADVGPGLLLTCALFAFGHSVVLFQWWHFAIFFPSLLFGWMRARTGGVIAGAFFHAWCNVTVSTLDTLYGIIPPG